MYLHGLRRWTPLKRQTRLYTAVWIQA